MQADLARVAGRVFAGVQMVLEEVAAQAPEARVVALSLLPLQPPWCGVDGPRWEQGPAVWIGVGVGGGGGGEALWQGKLQAADRSVHSGQVGCRLAWWWLAGDTCVPYPLAALHGFL